MPTAMTSVNAEQGTLVMESAIVEMTMNVRLYLKFVAYMPTAPTMLAVTTVTVYLDSFRMEQSNFKLMMGPPATI